jgi:hypothetical protein
MWTNGILFSETPIVRVLAIELVSACAITGAIQKAALHVKRGNSADLNKFDKFADNLGEWFTVIRRG